VSGTMVGVNETALRSLLEDLRSGAVQIDEVMTELIRLPFADLGDAMVDHHRELRQGLPEVVYGPGKSPDQCVRILGELLAHGQGPVLITRASAEQIAAAVAAHGPTYGEPVRSGGCALWRAPAQVRTAKILVITAGTSDTTVADEAAITLAAHGLIPHRISDVGVAGLHRFLARLDDITEAEAIIVVAGMEGALASVVGGITAVPVVAVPTSVGYGSGLDGVTALLAMHASCASGVTVVGIDNGFGAATAIARIMRGR
jgi:pyridinium-3,5-biscarboxylic acid mononucleotide synthase